MRDLDGKIALVTGSSRGIGKAIAECLARNGARLVLHGRDEGSLQQGRSEIEAKGGSALWVTGDVTKLADIETMRQQVERELGPVEILVACAGGSFTKPGPVEEMTEEAWHASVEGNLTATFLTLKVFLPGMKQRRSGCIITMSSSAARRPTPNAPASYSAAKAGIIVLTQAVAAQAGPFGIRANCIAPETVMTERNLHNIPVPMQKSLAEKHPLQRLGTPDDVAGAALYLASNESSWVTGLVLDVTGGAVMV